MANGTETVTIVELDIDQKQLLKDITKQQQEINDLKDDTKNLTKANKDLEAEGKKNSKQYKENSTAIEKNKIQTKGLSTEYRDNQKTLVALNTSETKQLGTLQKLEIQNKELRQEAKSLDLTRASGQKRLKEVNKQLDANNKFIAKNADATKKQKLNIGNYGSALQGLPGPLAGATRGVGILNTAFKFLIANPIGLILAAIALAIKAIGDAISKNQAALDRFKAIADGISASYNVLLDRINGVGRAIKALGKLNFKTIKDGFRGIGQEMVEEFKAARQLREELQLLRDQEIGDIVRKAELRKAVELARLASKEATITERERLKFIQDAIKVEEELLKIELEAATERARISQEQLDLGDSTRKEIEENAILQARVIEVETASLKRRRTLASELKTVELKAAKEKLDISEQEMLAAAKAFDNEIKLERVKSATINEIRDEDVEKQKGRAEVLNTIARDQGEVDIEIARLVSDTKFAVAQNIAGSLARLFGQQTAIGKAAAVAEATINTYRSAVAAYAAVAGIPGVGPIWAPLAAGAATTFGLANVRKILKVNSGLPGGGGSGGGIPSPTFAGAPGSIPLGAANLNDGGLTTRSLTDPSAIQQGIERALASAPQKVAIIEEITAKQRSQKAVSVVATV